MLLSMVWLFVEVSVQMALLTRFQPMTSRLLQRDVPLPNDAPVPLIDGTPAPPAVDASDTPGVIPAPLANGTPAPLVDGAPAAPVFYYS